MPHSPSISVRSLTLLVAATTLALSACTTTKPHTENDVTLFAAASLSAVGTELINAYTSENPQATITATYAGSSQLITQLAEGAQTDLLITADHTTMQAAQERVDQLTKTQPTVLATNTLVLVTAPGNPANIDHISDLAQPGIITALCAPQVPCGQLATRELERTATTPATATEEANVTAVATKISTGQVDAGFIYTTDAQTLQATTEGISVLTLPELEPTSYPLALTATGQANPTATDFAHWLTHSDQAHEILTTYGFTPA